jgi:hypothetical protein
MSHMGVTIKRMIRLYGENLPHRSRVKVITDGEEDITFTDESAKRGQVNEITPFDEVRNIWGTKINADFIVTLTPDTVIAAKDMLYIRGCWCDIDTYILHKTGNVSDYIELFCRKRT